MKKGTKVRLGIFDIDGTIFRSNLFFELFHALIERGIFPKRAEKEIEKYYLPWFHRTGTYDSYKNEIIRLQKKYIKGKKKIDINAIAENIVSSQKNKVYRFTRDLIRRLKKEQYHLVAVSGSHDFMVRRFSANFGFDASFGSVSMIKKGRFTGELDLESLHNKNLVLKKFAKEKNLIIDWENSVGVGDTENDIRFLEMVGHPIAFNPNATLARHAKKKKWTIIVERKDVIYELKDFLFKK
ncbi:MAG: HAD-IB family hydrolase [Patescibacteria group bacterium]